MKKRYMYQWIGVMSAVLLTLCGCNQKKDIVVEQKDTLAETSGIALLDIEDMFSNRDIQNDFDEAAGIHIVMSGNSAVCDSEKVSVEEGRIRITDEGTYVFEGKLDNGQIVVDAEKTDKLQLVLNGADITCKDSAAIYVKEADKVFVTLASNTENSVSVTGKFAEIDDNNIDGAIFSKSDLTLNGLGALKIFSEEGHGIVSKDDLVVAGGNIRIQAAGHGMEGKDSVRIADGNFCISVKEDGIHSENSDDAALGFVYISGGEFVMNVGDDGIHAGAQLVIDGGDISIETCYEGLEGQTVDIRGGNITLQSEDDGINAASPQDAEGEDDPFEVDENCYIHISDGTVNIVAFGDGMDSNGNLEISGGATYISGPEDGGNGSLDYTGEGRITGGILVAAGHSGMSQNFGEHSTQGAILVKLSQTLEAGNEIRLLDAEGKELIRFLPDTSYNCVQVSCPEIAMGNTYTLNAGTEMQEIEMSTLIYGAGDMGGMPGGKSPGKMPGGERTGEMPMGGKPGKMPDGKEPEKMMERMQK